MSRLICETNEYLELEQYLHNEPDDYSPWELDGAGDEKYEHVVHEAARYAFYEIRCTYRIDKNTGVVTYVSYDEHL